MGRSNAHWKLDAIDAYAGDRPLAWVDDALNDACHEWASARAAPTLLVQTDPQRGLTEREASLLAQWAAKHAARLLLGEGTLFRHLQLGELLDEARVGAAGADLLQRGEVGVELLP